MRRTKIVCTLGPATADDEILRELMRSGMNVGRQNFSHGSHESHKKVLDQLKRIREELNVPVASLLDTKGPEVRVKQFLEGRVTLIDKEQFILTTAECEGTHERVSITYKELPNDIDVGSRILVDDGLIELTVTDITEVEGGTDIVTRVIHGGTISNNKSCNFPGKKLSMPYISERDASDLKFACEEGFDFVAASFVRSDDDILEVRSILDENGGKDIKIIAKIESQDGVDNIDNIIRVSDGIMVARGDMGVEINFEELPRIQKMLIKKGYNAGKQVITATQMLDSMIKNPRPTRAETTDVANAIYDGTSAIMLSGETAAGMYPVEALRTMVKIAEKTESNIDYAKRFAERSGSDSVDVTNAIAHASVTTAIDLHARAILTVTHGGQTAKLLSKFRPVQPILAGTPNPKTLRQLNLSWGVVPVLTNEMNETDSLLDHAVKCAEDLGHLESGDLVVITAGVPLGVSGTTNMMKVHMVGNVLVSGTGVVKKTVTAPICVAKSIDEAIKTFSKGDILVIRETDNSLLNVLKSASGIVVESEGASCHAAIVGLTLDIPVITGAKLATQVLKSGTTVTLDGEKGLIRAN
ncbi:MAG: pyruvate kinase [Oscillospiraceae bacterium]|jgi:pyruvate kinase|nr:pyruvate kinase [Oscillospiraceae bacterium]